MGFDLPPANDNTKKRRSLRSVFIDAAIGIGIGIGILSYVLRITQFVQEYRSEQTYPRDVSATLACATKSAAAAHLPVTFTRTSSDVFRRASHDGYNTRHLYLLTDPLTRDDTPYGNNKNELFITVHLSTAPNPLIGFLSSHDITQENRIVNTIVSAAPTNLRNLTNYLISNKSLKILDDCAKRYLRERRYRSATFPFQRSTPSTIRYLKEAEQRRILDEATSQSQPLSNVPF